MGGRGSSPLLTRTLATNVTHQCTRKNCALGEPARRLQRHYVCTTQRRQPETILQRAEQIEGSKQRTHEARTTTGKKESDTTTKNKTSRCSHHRSTAGKLDSSQPLGRITDLSQRHWWEVVLWYRSVAKTAPVLHIQHDLIYNMQKNTSCQKIVAVPCFD